ncbi:hypothetical protein [Streptomyces sp. NPDC058657]|uniref:hypothetical protein n=1 Tax=unclassified Streptomyces TaxID=2593676 RepID=UPI00365B85AC
MPDFEYPGPRPDAEQHPLGTFTFAGESQQPARLSILTVSFLGFRAQAEGRTGFAALQAMRRQDNPALVRNLCLYLGAMWLAVAVVITLYLT